MNNWDWLPPELSPWLVPALLGVAFVSGLVSLLIRLRRTRPAPPPPPQSNPDLLLGSLTPALAEQLPTSLEARGELHKDLRAAGYYRPSAFMEYAALRTVLVVTPLAATGLLALLAEDEQLVSILVGGGIVSLLGFSIPRIVLHLQGRQRVRQIEAGLPLAVDLLTLCLTAGQNLLWAFRRVSDELGRSHPVLAEEFGIIRRQAELRNLAFALSQWAQRTPSGEVRSLALILGQAEQLGTDSATALQEYSTNLRTNARQAADTRANQTMFWMLFPTILCLWIPAGILLIAPAVLEFQEQRQTTFQEWRDSREQLRGGAPAATSPAPGAIALARE